MNKLQFWMLNFASVTLVALLASHFFYSRANGRLGDALNQERAAINQARQAEGILDQIAKRIARGSDTDPKLKNLLVKYGMKVTLETDGRKKNYP